MSAHSQGSRVLDIRDLYCGYGETEILHGVSLHVDPGEIVVIIGPNGAGKSTAMKAVFGMSRVTGGAIDLDGRDITGLQPDRVVRQGVCYVPQTSNVFVNLSVEENLEMGAYVRTDDFRPRIEEMYTLFPDLREKRHQPAGTLSGGQRQMVAMAKALMLDPKILLLDEPTAGLSPKFRGEIFRVVREINAAGTPILMVEQNAKQALGIADRGYILVDGTNRLDDTGPGLLANKEVAEMFLGGKASGKAGGKPSKKTGGKTKPRKPAAKETAG
jgi:branched-chain amino acid transport system ATP-binding protein